MTTMNQAREAIIGRFIANYVPVAFADVAAENREALYSFDNEQAEAGQAVAPPGASWCRVTIQETQSGQETLGPVGARRYRRNGVVRMSLYCPADRGTLKNDSMVKPFRDAFEGVSFSGLYFTDCQVSDLGVEGAAWRVDALAVFWFEERK